MKSMKFERDQVVDFFEETFRDQASTIMAEAAVIELVRSGAISAGKGGDLLGLTRWAFDDLLAKHNVLSLELSAEELADQLRPLGDQTGAV
ncbi:MAG: hypothetical protein CMLOHMNK_03344 [Steroidobacteraceae bacterium]|nr:hypothetical protein [Steroidobacteraceae bacterium]